MSETPLHREVTHFCLHYGDLSDSSNLVRIAQESQADKIYNLDAILACAGYVRKRTTTDYKLSMASPVLFPSSECMPYECSGCKAVR